MNKYKALIQNLPVQLQCFTTKRKTWQKAENEVEWLKKFNDDLFLNRKTRTISRNDIFNTNGLRNIIIKTIYWGYPRGMRGNHFIDILSNIESIETAIEEVKKDSEFNSTHYKDLVDAFRKVRGLGISTYSKLLYFYEVSFNDNPCLILDLRLINVFKDEIYKEYSSISDIRYSNADKKYLQYLEITNSLSKELDTKGENIEQFLFLFGNNIKE